VTAEAMDVKADGMESVAAFRQRARAWIRANLTPVDPESQVSYWSRDESDAEELAEVSRHRALQRQLFDAGFAGICFPRQYGGQGLSPAHQQALNQELAGYVYPWRIQLPTFNPCASVLLDFASHEQKLRHIPAILRGEEIWMQLLSEPSGGSDVAGALTTAVRDGDEWVINGSKIWTTGAWWSDWGLCLARTNWEVPKHRGLSVFMMQIHQPGIEVQRIEMLNGSREFCQEFMSDVRIPDADRIGDVDDGWTVGTRWMFHERMFLNSPYMTIAPGFGRREGGITPSLVDLARRSGQLDDALVRDRIGEAHTLDVVRHELSRRLTEGLLTGTMPDQAAAIGRLFDGHVSTRVFTIGFELAGSSAVAWTDDQPEAGEQGTGFLVRQAACIAGGTTEMARNVISERVLGMPRERTLDRDRPFREVPRGGSARP
jgi:alkylation response protein AidB-like acyl-CoA dehydrogenase